MMQVQPLLTPREEEESDNGLAVKLRQATMQAHHDVMLPRVVHRLSSGDLPLAVYIAYLQALLVVYKSLEKALELHATNEILSSIYNPTLLARSAGIESDISYLRFRTLRDGHVDGSIDGTNWESARKYASRIDKISNRQSLGRGEEDSGSKRSSDFSALLLAHSYTRYLGDLSGGQSIARSVRRAYSLPDSGEGSQFYDFFPVARARGSGLGTRADMKEVKDIKSWFRTGLNTAGQHMDEELKVAIANEAKLAFKFNAELFSDLEMVLLEYESSDRPMQISLKSGLALRWSSALWPLHVTSWWLSYTLTVGALIVLVPYLLMPFLRI